MLAYDDDNKLLLPGIDQEFMVGLAIKWPENRTVYLFCLSY